MQALATPIETAPTVYEQPLGEEVAYVRALVTEHRDRWQFNSATGHIFNDLIAQLPVIEGLELPRRQLCHRVAETVYPLVANLFARNVTLTLTGSAVPMVPEIMTDVLATYTIFDIERGLLRHVFVSPHQEIPEVALLPIKTGLVLRCVPLHYHFRQLPDILPHTAHPRLNLFEWTRNAVNDWYEAQPPAAPEPDPRFITAPSHLSPTPDLGEEATVGTAAVAATLAAEPVLARTITPAVASPMSEPKPVVATVLEPVITAPTTSVSFAPLFRMPGIGVTPSLSAAMSEPINAPILPQATASSPLVELISETPLVASFEAAASVETIAKSPVAAVETVIIPAVAPIAEVKSESPHHEIAPVAVEAPAAAVSPSPPAIEEVPASTSSWPSFTIPTIRQILSVFPVPTPEAQAAVTISDKAMETPVITTAPQPVSVVSEQPVAMEIVAPRVEQASAPASQIAVETPRFELVTEISSVEQKSIQPDAPSSAMVEQKAEPQAAAVAKLVDEAPSESSTELPSLEPLIEMAVVEKELDVPSASHLKPALHENILRTAMEAETLFEPKISASKPHEPVATKSYEPMRVSAQPASNDLRVAAASPTPRKLPQRFSTHPSYVQTREQRLALAHVAGLNNAAYAPGYFRLLNLHPEHASYAVLSPRSIGMPKPLPVRTLVADPKPAKPKVDLVAKASPKPTTAMHPTPHLALYRLVPKLTDEA